MSAVLTRPRSIASNDSDRTAGQARTSQPAPAIDGRPCSAGFAALLGAYRSSGGSTRGDDLARLLEDRQRSDGVSLARLIECGAAFGFEWRETLWIPMFQFDSRDLAVKSGVRQALVELSADFDGWELAAWFASGNTWLGGHRPVDLMESDLPAVLGAARADRFVAAG